jgi:hypothetical protein
MYGLPDPYAPTVIDGKMHVWLIAVGWWPARQVKDLRVGDTLKYNYGSVSTITAITPSAKTAVIETEHKYTVRLALTTWRAVA